jgi:protein TonB
METRQCLADGELELAEEVLRKGLESFGQEPAILALREELQSGREYRETLRTGQILFGRRQLREAERILSTLVDQNRPEAQALLDAVKGARAAADEENFCERGREKAVELIQQRQFAQAADLLRNLLALFPGDSILERDLMVAQNGLDQELPEAAPAASKENVEPPPLVIATASQPELQPVAPTGPADRAPVREIAPLRFRRASIVGTVSLVLISAAGAAWNFSRKGVAVSGQAVKPASTQLPAAAALPVTQVTAGPNTAAPGETPQASSPQPPAHQAFAAAAGGPSSQPPLPPQAPLRPFVPLGANQAAVQPKSSPLPLPPKTEPVISTETINRPIAGVVKPVDAPAPPRAAAPAVAPAVVPKPNPAAPVGGKVTEAQVVERFLPVYPPLAREHAFLRIVRLEAAIDERGAVKDVKVLSGDPVLAAAAKAAVKLWKYKPATLNDRPIASKAIITVNFGEGSR